LWDESLNFYPRFGGIPNQRGHEWRWPRAGKIKFAHLQFDNTVYHWQGAQIALICFDELTHFTAHQFYYLLSRNRSTCGVRPYIRATCNPDADSWVADFLAWWIDQETGFPIPERAGVLRYFIRVAEKTVWADRAEELMQQMPRPQDLPPGADPPRPISVTFIPAKVFDNPALLQVNPEYLAWLLSLPLLERERLLGGNWKIRPAAGLYFKREWCAVADAAPADLDVVRYWDLAATEKTELNDPDWTAGVKLGRDQNGGYWLLDVVRARANPGDVERLLLETAARDGKRVKIGFGRDPGQAGKSQALHLVRALGGFTVVMGEVGEAFEDPEQVFVPEASHNFDDFITTRFTAGVFRQYPSKASSFVAALRRRQHWLFDPRRACRGAATHARAQPQVNCGAGDQLDLFPRAVGAEIAVARSAGAAGCQPCTRPRPNESSAVPRRLQD
jgi:hypothetical protein